jgi:hypothetical protein
MYKSMFLLTFYAFLRIGEFTVAATNSTNHCLKFSSIDEKASNNWSTVAFNFSAVVVLG